MQVVSEQSKQIWYFSDSKMDPNTVILFAFFAFVKVYAFSLLYNILT